MTSHRWGITGRSSVLAAMLALALVMAGALPGFSAEAAPKTGPRVVIIVGPTGSLTAGFRAEAEAAARAARRYTDDVVTIYSPHATWAAVRSALQGASLVVYMGHGNGWPSIHRDSPYPRTQNGLGLNPVAGGDDDTHRYYGEQYLAREVKLAPGAVVLLHHLCYAAGNSEPGLPEGPHDVAKQRVENFAAGWLATGASAVVAEAYLAPRYYVRAILGTNQDVETIWRSSPTYKNNVDAWVSRRTEGATAFIDQTRSGRFGRSVVVLDGGSTFERGGGTNGGTDAQFLDDRDPPPPLAGLEFGAPEIDGPLVSWSTVELRLPYVLSQGTSIPEGIAIGAEWQPLQLDGGPVSIEELATRHLLALGAEDVDEAAANDSADDPADDPEETAAPEVDGYREPLPAEVNLRSLDVPLLTPELSGLYQLWVTLHDADDRPLELAGEPLERPLLYVAPPLSASFELSLEPEADGDAEPPAELEADVAAQLPQLEAFAGQPVELLLVLGNNGIVSWEQDEYGVAEERGPDLFRVIPPLPAQLVGYAAKSGVALERQLVSEGPMFAVEAHVQPGETREFQLAFYAPGAAGQYLVILDVVTPSYGSLAGRGVAPGLLLLNVGPAPLPEPEPTRR